VLQNFASLAAPRFQAVRRQHNPPLSSGNCRCSMRGLAVHSDDDALGHRFGITRLNVSPAGVDTGSREKRAALGVRHGGLSRRSRWRRETSPPNGSDVRARCCRSSPSSTTDQRVRFDRGQVDRHQRARRKGSSWAPGRANDVPPKGHSEWHEAVGGDQADEAAAATVQARAARRGHPPCPPLHGLGALTSARPTRTVWA